jgi:hypothetical protein
MTGGGLLLVGVVGWAFWLLVLMVGRRYGVRDTTMR